MSVSYHNPLEKQLRCEVVVMRSVLDRILKTIERILVLGVILSIVSIVYLETSVGVPAVVLAIAALLLVALVRDVPINDFEIGGDSWLYVNLEVRDRPPTDTEESKGADD